MIPAFIIGIICIFPYSRSLSYALTTQEIVVNKGFIVKRTKIIPYRNITNIVIRRGLLDRMMGGDNFGSIQVEIAGQSAQKSAPEQTLDEEELLKRILGTLQEISNKL